MTTQSKQISEYRQEFMTGWWIGKYAEDCARTGNFRVDPEIVSVVDLYLHFVQCMCTYLNKRNRSKPFFDKLAQTVPADPMLGVRFADLLAVFGAMLVWAPSGYVMTPAQEQARKPWHDWFKKFAQGYRLSPADRAAVLRNAENFASDWRGYATTGRASRADFEKFLPAFLRGVFLMPYLALENGFLEAIDERVVLGSDSQMPETFSRQLAVVARQATLTFAGFHFEKIVK